MSLQSPLNVSCCHQDASWRSMQRWWSRCAMTLRDGRQTPHFLWHPRGNAEHKTLISFLRMLTRHCCLSSWDPQRGNTSANLASRLLPRRPISTRAADAAAPQSRTHLQSLGLLRMSTSMLAGTSTSSTLRVLVKPKADTCGAETTRQSPLERACVFDPLLFTMPGSALRYRHGLI